MMLGVLITFNAYSLMVIISLKLDISLARDQGSEITTFSKSPN